MTKDGTIIVLIWMVTTFYCKDNGETRALGDLLGTT